KTIVMIRTISASAPSARTTLRIRRSATGSPIWSEAGAVSGAPATVVSTADAGAATVVAGAVPAAGTVVAACAGRLAAAAAGASPMPPPPTTAPTGSRTASTPAEQRPVLCFMKGGVSRGQGSSLVRRAGVRRAPADGAPLQRGPVPRAHRAPLTGHLQVARVAATPGH